MRLAASLVTVIWICLEVWAVGPVMRESDQAAILEGAIELVHGTSSLGDNDSYNYDKQFLSYWLVAEWLKLRGARVEDGSMSVVREGNLLAVTLFALALLWVVGSQRKWSGGQVAVLYCALFSPVLAFSGMFLSSNMISGAFLLILVVLLRSTPGQDASAEEERPSIVKLGLIGLTTWAATAARQDAILLMPLLALFGWKGGSLLNLIKDRRVVVMVIASLFAIGLGYFLSVDHAPITSPFFVLPTFVAYLGGGLGALLLLILTFGGALVGKRSLRGLMLGGAAILPLLFYSSLLYTPRHFFLAALCILLTVFFDEGRKIWVSIMQGRLGRLVVALTVLGTILPWIVGVRMSAWKSARPVSAAPTLFPSTDGFWPMGAYGWFFSRLANGADAPVDHNQQVWRAWSRIDGTKIPAGKGAVLSSGLVSFGTFHLSWFGKEGAATLEEADFVLFDERTLGKRQRGVNATEGGNRDRLLKLLEQGNFELVGEAFGQRILLWTRSTAKVIEPSVSAKLALHQYFQGNDFRAASWQKEDWNLDELEGHRGLVAGRSRASMERIRSQFLATDELLSLKTDYDPEPWWAIEVNSSKLRELSEEDLAGLTVAFGSLPSFMDVRRYGTARTKKVSR